MAKKFLTNINLAGNQLLNAAIQPSASAPSALSAGQLYYNTNDGIFYFSTGTGTGNWEPVGVQYIKSVSGNLSVDGNGLLSLDEAGLAGDLASGSNYITYSGSTLNLNLSSLETQLTNDGFASQSDISSAISAASSNYDAAGAASSAQSAAQSYADSLASNYDAAGAASSALSTAQSYADSLASNYDPAGAASSAISALNIGLNSSGDVVTTDGTQDLYNKTLDSVIVKGDAYFQSGGGAGGTNNYISVDNSTGTLTLNSGYPLTLAAADDINLNPSTGYNVKINGVNVATINDIQASKAGLSVKDSVKFLSTDNVLTVGNYGFNSDISSVVVGDRVLFINQTNASDNGIYTVTENQGSEGAVTRAADQNTPKEGDFVFVEEGEYAAQGWVAQADLTWAQFASAGEYTFNGGLQISGTTVSVDYTSLESQLVSDDFAKNADYTTVTRKYSNSITGNSTDSTFAFTHGLNSRDVVVRVYQTSSGADQYNDIEVDVTRTSVNAISISFASAPATGESYAVVVVG